MRFSWTVSRTALAVATVLAPTLHQSQAADPAPPALTAITATTSDWLNTSRPLQAKDLANRIVLLDFWTYCCINCMHIVPELKKLENQFHDDLVVIGVHSAKFDNEKDTANIRSAILRYEIEHPVVNDSAFQIWNRFGANAWPTLVLIAPSGEIVRSWSGEGHFKDIAQEIQKLKGQVTHRKPLPIQLERSKEPPKPFSFPSKMAYDPVVKILYVLDSSHHQVVALGYDPVKSPERAIEKFRIGLKGVPGKTDGSFAEAQFNRPQGILLEPTVQISGRSKSPATEKLAAERPDVEKLWIADTENHLIREIDLKAKTVKTIAGTGVQGYDRQVKNADALKTPLASPWDLAWYPDSKTLTIAMAGTHQLWTLDLKSSKLSVLAGNGRESIDDGVYPKNSLSQPSGLLVTDPSRLVFVDSETSSLRALQNGKVSTWIGSGLFDFGFKDGASGTALLQHPLDLERGSKDEILIADDYNHSLRSYDSAKRKLRTVLGSGKRGQPLNEPAGLLRIGEATVIADTNAHRLLIWKEGIAPKEIAIEKPKEPRKLAERLPAKKLIPDQTVRAGATLEIELPKDEKLNDLAPSFVAIFDSKGQPVADWASTDLKSTFKNGKITKELPKFEASTSYRLQGTLYHCEDRPAAVCRIQSVDFSIQADPKGVSRIAIAL